MENTELEEDVIPEYAAEEAYDQMRENAFKELEDNIDKLITYHTDNIYYKRNKFALAKHITNMVCEKLIDGFPGVKA